MPRPASPPAPAPLVPRSSFGPGRDPRSSLGPLEGPKDDRLPSVAEENARLDRLEAELLDLKGEIARLREALGD
jgi:hypothetical protein